MGMEVLPAVDNKGKQPLHPMPDEVVLPPTAEEDPKTPEGDDDEGMEEPPSNKRRNYGHYHQEDDPTHFCKVILAPKLECIPMPLDFTKHFVAGWATYAAVHQIKIGYMVTFKLLTPDTLKVIIFDDDGIEALHTTKHHALGLSTNMQATKH
ncbi:unnamed protein product [Triticum aestivum]|uniref:TF-B3 domain-containing protein n=1 Tax=Triticum aestivum TaxID=4565 RepID=A0A7H4LKT7_WHEAT|nr:unnamed protein product [Triticum aestivum]